MSYHRFSQRRKLALRLSLAVCSSLLGVQANAQGTNPPADAAGGRPADLTEDETVVLSPFQVTADRDNGYIATNSLAGSRLNSPLVDTPASISVLTKDFLDDIGALNVNQAVEFALNTGNDIGGGGSDVGATTGNNLVGRDYNLMIRNYRNATQTRSYFDTILTGDAFNIDRIDISRGPNSLLFGIGSVGGIVNVTPKQALIGRNTNEVLLRTGSYSRNRAALDVNRTLIDEKLAVRINLMYQDADGYHDFEADDQRRGALALVWKPKKSTTLRVDFEKGKLHQVKVRPWLLFDGITNWEVWGSNFVPFGTPESPWVAGDDNYSQQIRSNGTGAPSNNLPALPSDPFWGGEFRSAGNLVAPSGRAVFMDGPLAGKVLYLGTRAEGARYYRTSAGRNVPNYNSPDTWDDESVYPRTGNMSGPGQYVDNDYHIIGATIEQRLGKSLYLEAAVNHSKVDKVNHEAVPFSNIAAVMYDVTTTLPTFAVDGNYDGTLVANAAQATAAGKGVGTLTLNQPIPNPYAGGLIAISKPQGTDSWTSRDDARLSATYNLDLGRFGRHMLLAFAQRSESSYEGKSYAEANVHPNRASTNYFSNVPPRIYHYDPFAANLADRGVPDPWKNPIPPTSLYGRPSEMFQSGFITNDWTKSKSRIDSLAVAAQSSFFDHALVTTVGGRRDNIVNHSWSRVLDSATQEVTGLTPPTTPSLDETGYSYSLGAVYHIPVSFLKGVSLFANKSTNFKDQAGAKYFEDVDVRQQLDIGPLTGVGYDFGLKFELLEGRVNATITRFEVNLDKLTFGHQNNVFNDINAIWDTILANGPNDGSNLNTRNVGGSDTRSQKSMGYELEVTANLTPNWRVSLNVSKAENVISNLGSALSGYLEEHRSEWQSNSGLNYNTSRSPGFLTNPGGANTIGALIYDLDAWLAFVKAQEGQMETNLRPWNGNMFTAYEFNSGLLKGLTIGGGLNYRGEAILGTVPATVANPESISTKGRSYYTSTGMLGYKFSLSDGVDVKLQLNVQNLFDNHEKQVLASNWNPGLNGGQGGFQLFEYYFEPRSYNLTATFDF